MVIKINQLLTKERKCKLYIVYNTEKQKKLLISDHLNSIKKMHSNLFLIIYISFYLLYI